MCILEVSMHLLAALEACFEHVAHSLASDMSTHSCTAGREQQEQTTATQHCSESIQADDIRAP